MTMRCPNEEYERIVRFLHARPQRETFPRSSDPVLEKPGSGEKLGPILRLSIVAAIIWISMVAGPRFRRDRIRPQVYPALHIKLRTRLQGALLGRRYGACKSWVIVKIALLEGIKIVFLWYCGRGQGWRWQRRRKWLAW
jgi:hypothetical protein